MEAGKGHLAALENPRGRVVAGASLVEVPSYHEQHVKVLNLIAAPAYFRQAADLLASVIEESRESGTEVVHAYLADRDADKRDILEAAGFRQEARLRGAVKLDGPDRADLLILVRHLGRRSGFKRPPGNYYGGTPAYLA